MKIRLCLLLLPLAAFSSLAHAVPVKVIVTGPDDKPVAGAKIEYYATDFTLPGKTLPGKLSPTINSAQTGNDGTMALDLPEPAPATATKPWAKNPILPYLGWARITATGLGIQTFYLEKGDNTVKLQRAAQASGVINGFDSKPAPGVKVRLDSVIIEKGIRKYPYLSSPFPNVEAVTQADGSWHIDGLPPEGTARFKIEAPQASTATFELVLAGPQNRAETQTLKKGVTIRGRVIDGEGKPIAGAIVYANGQIAALATTDDKGIYVLSGVDTGKLSLRATNLGADWVIPLQGFPVSVPETGGEVKAPDIVANKGVLISGRLLDKTNRAPIANHEFRSFGSSSSPIRTDAQGKFSFRVPEGEHWIRLTDISGEYLFPDRPRNLISLNKDTDLGDVAMERGYTLTFDVRDEAGNPAPEVQLALQKGTGALYFGGNTRNHILSAGGQAAGTYHLDARGDWELLSPQQVVVGDNAVPFTTIPVRVRKASLPIVTGTVVDDEGKPIGGATVSLKLKTAWEGFTDKTITANADGSWAFTLGERKLVPSIEAVKQTGYQHVGGGTFVKQGANWQASPVVVSRYDAQLKGRVVDAKGKPVAGAHVMWPDSPKTIFAQTSKDGTFTLAGVPRTEITLWASDGPRFTAIKGNTQQSNEIKLLSAPRAPKLDTLRETLWAQAPTVPITALSYYEGVLGKERLLEAALRADGVIKPDGTRSSSKAGKNFDSLLVYLFQENSEPAIQAGVEWLRHISPQDISWGAALFALRAAQSRNAQARAWAGKWFDSQRLDVLQDGKRLGATEYALAVGTVGLALGRPNGAAYRDVGLKMIEDKSKTAYNPYYGTLWGQILWFGGKSHFDAAIAKWNLLTQKMAIAGALESVKTSEEARSLLAELNTLNSRLSAQSPVILPVAQGQEQAKTSPSPLTMAFSPDRARANAVQALATTDAKAALEFLLQIEDGYEAQEPARILTQAAIKAKRFDLARTAAAVALKDNQAGRPNAARMAALVQGFAPALSQQLLNYASPTSEPRDDTREANKRTEVYYAMAVQGSAPGLGRLLLEREWARIAPVKNAPGTDYEYARKARSVIWAMFTYNDARAQELFAQLPAQSYKTLLIADLLGLAFDKKKRVPLRLVNEL